MELDIVGIIELNAKHTEKSLSAKNAKYAKSVKKHKKSKNVSRADFTRNQTRALLQDEPDLAAPYGCKSEYLWGFLAPLGPFLDHSKVLLHQVLRAYLSDTILKKMGPDSGWFKAEAPTASCQS